MSAELEDLLDQTRDALIAGNLPGLAGLAEKVALLAGTLPRLDRPAADRLHRKAERNARLLQAATRGIKAARQRISDIGTFPALTTYDMRGRREVISATQALPLRRV